jgi:hypothetical protein
MMVLLRFLTKNDTTHEIWLFGEVLSIGLAMCLIMTPVLSEIFSAVEDLEKQKPGRFHPYGAFAQAVPDPARSLPSITLTHVVRPFRVLLRRGPVDWAPGW